MPRPCRWRVVWLGGGDEALAGGFGDAELVRSRAEELPSEALVTGAVQRPRGGRASPPRRGAHVPAGL